MSHSLEQRIEKKSTLRFIQLAFFCLLILLPFQKKFKILKPLASSFTQGFHFPEAFQKNIYFFVTDFVLIFFAILLFVNARRALLEKSSKFLMLLWCVFLISLLSSSSCPIHYLRLLHLFLLITLFAALEKGLIFPNLSSFFPKIALCIALVSVPECVIGILQYGLQKSLGFGWLGEVSNNSWVSHFQAPLFSFGATAHEMMRRASGTFPHPNVFGGFLVMTISCSYFLLASEKKRSIIPLLALQILTLCLTFSRAALIAWFLMTAIFCVLCLRMRISIRLFAGIIAIALVGSLLIFYPAIKARGGIVNYNKTVKESDAGRVQFQNIALEMVKKHPLLGIGFNQYVVRMQEFSKEPLRGDQFFPAHNVYFLIAAESGLLGLACFLFFVGGLILRASRQEMTLVKASLLSLFIGLLFINLCDFYLWGSQHGKLIFFMSAGLLSLSAREEQNEWACR